MDKRTEQRLYKEIRQLYLELASQANKLLNYQKDTDYVYRDLKSSSSDERHERSEYWGELSDTLDELGEATTNLNDVLQTLSEALDE